MAGGPEVNESGVCIKSTVMYTIAQSPAYVLNGMYQLILQIHKSLAFS